MPYRKNMWHVSICDTRIGMWHAYRYVTRASVCDTRINMWHAYGYVTRIDMWHAYRYVTRVSICDTRIDNLREFKYFVKFKRSFTPAGCVYPRFKSFAGADRWV